VISRYPRHRAARAAARLALRTIAAAAAAALLIAAAPVSLVALVSVAVAWQPGWQPRQL